MARIRSVHPDVCLDETLADASPRAERTFMRLWTHLDDEGRCIDNPKLIKAALYPLHDDMAAVDVDDDLTELASLGLIRRYQVAGRAVLCAKPEAWARYQKPRHPSPSKLPAPPDPDSEPPTDDGCPTAQRRNGSADSGHPPAERRQAPALVGDGVGDGEGGGGNPPSSSRALALVGSDVSPSATGDVAIVMDAWREATGHTRALLDPKRSRLITKALKAYPVDDVIDAVRGWKHSPHHRGENERGTVYDDIELLLRDAAHIERFRDLERGARRPVRPSAPASFAAIERLGP